MGGRVSKKDVKVPHFYFGEVSQRIEFNKEIITVSQKMLRRDEYDDWLKTYREVKSLYHESLFIPESYEIEEIKKFLACCECPADFEISLSYQKFQYLYKSEIVQRKKQGQFYQESELLLILFKFLTGLKEFQLAGKRVGDIRPSQMVITNQREIQMINLASFPTEMSSLDKILDNYDKKTVFYLAPEELELLNKKSRGRIADSKAESFSLAISILEAALLENSEDLYELRPTRSLNQSGVMERLQRVRQKYPVLESYLSLMLKLRPEDRLSGGQVWSMLSIYSEQISQKQGFRRDEAQEGRSLNQFRRKSSR